MPDDPEDTAGGTGTEPTPPATGSDTTDWKAKSREWEQRAKANKARADLADALQAERDELQAKLAAATRDTARLRIASAHGIDPELVFGDDVEAMEAHAAKIAEAIGRAKPTGHPDLRDIDKPKPGDPKGDPGSKAAAALRAVYGGKS